MSEDKNTLCVCGHLKRKHRKQGSGRCSKCGCEKFGEQPHPADCRCMVCLWNKVDTLEHNYRKMNAYINGDPLSLVNKHEDFLGRVFKVTPQDMIDLHNLRESENVKSPKVKPQATKERKLIGRPDAKKPVKAEPKAPQTPA